MMYSYLQIYPTGTRLYIPYCTGWSDGNPKLPGGWSQEKPCGRRLWGTECRNTLAFFSQGRDPWSDLGASCDSFFFQFFWLFIWQRTWFPQENHMVWERWNGGYQLYRYKWYNIKLQVGVQVKSFMQFHRKTEDLFPQTGLPVGFSLRKK